MDETIRVPTIRKLASSSSPASPPPGTAAPSRVRLIQSARRGRMSTGGRAPRRPSAVDNDTGMNQNYMLTVPPTSSIRHSVSGSPSPSPSTPLVADMTRTGAAMTGPSSNSDNHLEPFDQSLRRSTSVLAPGGHLRPASDLDNATRPASPSPITDSQQSHSSTPTSNSVVQALGDAFRVPIPGYSAPASIGDSTWRTLGFDGTTAGGSGGGANSNTGSGSGTRGRRGIGLGSAQPSAPTTPPRDDEVWTGDWAQSFVAGEHEANPVYGRQRDHERHENADYDEGEDEGGGILVIPSLGDRAVENDVHTLLEVHGIASRLPNEGESSGANGVERTRQRPRPRRLPSYRFLEEEEERSIGNTRDVDLDADGDVDAEVDDLNTGSSHGDYEYYPGRPPSSHRTVLGVGIRRYTEHDFGVEEEEEQQGIDDRMDVDVDMDVGGGVEEDCESEESEDEEDQNSSWTRVARQSLITGTSSRRHGTSSTSNAGASTSSATGTPSSIPFPKSSTHSGPNQRSQDPAHNYGFGSRYGYYDDLDLAGVCFDPSGQRMYVAGNGFGSPSDGGNGGVDIVGAGAVVEWGVGGAEKRWWVEEEGWK